MSEPTPAIELINVDVMGAELRADTVMIKNVTWTINRGDYWVVGGLPGTGKTDLLATAAGLQRPGAGTHLVFGRDLNQMDEGEQLRERLRLGMIFQLGGRLFSHQTIAENLALPVCYHRNCTFEEAHPQVQTILKVTELSGMERRRPHRLTRNLHQRVALARALMLEPEVLLIDNPLAGIDARQAYWWLDFLPRLAAGVPEFLHRKITLVVTTDDFRPWRAQGTRFALVNAKQWSIIGGRDELEKSADPAVRELLAPDFLRKES
jgi:ABC-type transporter Mla maintaining outer membrane lipid asymmetry ATPase subunit MlaF